MLLSDPVSGSYVEPWQGTGVPPCTAGQPLTVRAFSHRQGLLDCPSELSHFEVLLAPGDLGTCRLGLFALILDAVGHNG